jgi:hypothetical protein
LRVRLCSNEKTQALSLDVINEDREYVAAALDRALASLDPRSRFIVEWHYGIPVELSFDPAGLRARSQRVRFSHKETSVVLTRAKFVAIAPEATKLEIQQIAVLLTLGTRQVGRLLAQARNKLAATLEAEAA